MSTTSGSSQVLRLFLPLYLPSFLFAFSNGLLVPVLPLFAQEFEISYALVGLVLAGDAIGMLLGDLPAGMLMRRLGQKSSMLIGLLLSGFSTAGLFLAHSILVVVALRIIAGMGVSLFSVSRHYFITEMAPVATRGRVIALFGGFFRMGRLFGPIVGGLMGAALGLRASFLLFGVVCLIGVAVVFFLLPYIEIPAQAQGGRLRSPLQHYAGMLKVKWRDLSTAGVGFLFMQIIRAGPTTLVPLYAANYLNLGVEDIGLIVSLSAALDMLLFYPAGIVMDRYGRKATILTSNLFLSLGIGLVPLTGSFLTLLGAGMVAGLGSGIGSGSMLTLGADLAPKEGRSEFLGAWTLIGDVGNTSGPLLIGALADVIPLPMTGWAMVLGGVTAMAIFGRLVPETLKQHSPTV